MEHIFINVDEALFVPKVNLSLFEMVKKGGFHKLRNARMRW